MAGSYPDAPSRRMAWDFDGTLAFHSGASGWGSVPIIAFTPTQIGEMNDEDNIQAKSLTVKSGEGIGVIFPELREFDGLFTREFQGGALGALETSGDTTNMVDGSWTQQHANLPEPSGTTYERYRRDITSFAVSNVRAVRYVMNSLDNNPARIQSLHLYGEISPGQTPDRLLWVDTGTGLEFSLPIDFGDTPRGSAVDRTVKLRNNSSSLTANTVQITAEALYLSSGAWYTFSEGGAFQSTLQLASSIGPSADSPVVTIRRVIPDAETLGLHAGRAYANVAQWT